jgi:hypothetical protein
MARTSSASRFPTRTGPSRTPARGVAAARKRCSSGSWPGCPRSGGRSGWRRPASRGSPSRARNRGRPRGGRRRRAGGILECGATIASTGARPSASAMGRLRTTAVDRPMVPRPGAVSLRSNRVIASDVGDRHPRRVAQRTENEGEGPGRSAFSEPAAVEWGLLVASPDDHARMETVPAVAATSVWRRSPGARLVAAVGRTECLPFVVELRACRGSPPARPRVGPTGPIRPGDPQPAPWRGPRTMPPHPA